MSEINKHAQNETRRTQALVSAAAVCVLITVLIKWSSAPAAIESQGQIDTPFYPKFEDPTTAKSLGVYSFDSENIEPLSFEVSRTDLNEVWTVGKDHYPVDAEEQLAETAASVIGITRGALATRWEKEHAKYGVIDPQQGSINVTEVDGVGKRIIIKGQNDETLVDYIIGKQSPDKPGAYYVRTPGDDNVYISDVDIQLSTKFSDWISTSLLEVDASGVVHLSVETYSFDETGGQISIEPGDELVFSKPNATESWTTEGLDEESEEVNEAKIRSTVNAIGNLQIAGVRPKNQGLTSELTFDEDQINSQSDFQRLQLELLARGYALGRSDEDPEQLRLFSREGEIHVASEDGVVYELYFGRAFTGEAGEIEFGEDDAAVTDSPEESDDEGGDESGEASELDGEPEAEPSDTGSTGRYLFVRARFDEAFLGAKPVAPVAPVKPVDDNGDQPDDEGDAEDAPESEKDSESSPEADNEGDEGCQEEAAEAAEAAEAPASESPAKADSESDEGESDEGESDEEPVETPAEPAESNEGDDGEPEKSLEDLMAEYEAAMSEYEAAVRLYDERIREGQEKVDAANKRYALWYYVISGDSFDALNLERDDLVKVKGEDAPGPPMTPGIPGLNIPGLQGN